MADPAFLANFPAVLESVAADWKAHPADCASLKDFWFGGGGVTCPSDIGRCDGECGATFFVEGLGWGMADLAGDDEDVWLCDCCARSRLAPT